MSGLSRLKDAVTADVTAEMGTIKDATIARRFRDPADYHYQCGLHQGLAMALEKFEKRMKNMEGEDV
jgi:hypothetical protein